MYGVKCIGELEREHMSKVQQLIPIDKINAFRDALQVNQKIKLVRKVETTDKSGRVRGYRFETNYYTVKEKYPHCIILNEKRRNKAFKVPMDYTKLYILMHRRFAENE